jgi:hypothetical protein
MNRLISVFAALAMLATPALAIDESAVPPKFSIPWGNNAGAAYIRSIPTASQIGIQNCAASLTDGFPPLSFQASASGGCPPFGQDFNGILKQVTQWGQWQAAGGPLVFDNTFAANIGGYPRQGTLSNATTPGCWWVSQIDNNLGNPDAGALNWLNTCALGGVLSGTPYNASIVASGVTPSAYVAPTITVGADGRLIAASGIASSFMPSNVSISATVASNNLTIALTQTNGAAIGSIPYSANGAQLGLPLASTSSFTVPSGNTMGCVSGQACRLWVIAGAQSASIFTCAYNATSGTTVVPLIEGHSYVSGSGSGGGSSAQTLYCNSSSITAAVRYIGYIEIVQTSGLWSANPNFVMITGPSGPKPADVVRHQYGQFGATTAISNGSYIATATSVALFPSSAANLIRISVSGSISAIYNGTSNGLEVQIQLRRNTSTQVGITWPVIGPPCTGCASQSIGWQIGIPLIYDSPATTALTTYTVYVQGTTLGSGTWEPSTLTLEEIMG